MNAVLQLALAAYQGYKAMATGHAPPPGTKTVTTNLTVIVAWGVARMGLDVPGEVVDAVVAMLLVGVNLALRAVTTGPLPGGDDTPPQPAMDDPHND
jgi:hypothetical protein